MSELDGGGWTLVWQHSYMVSPPPIPCKSSNEGESLYKALHADIIWICKSKEWTPYK